MDMRGSGIYVRDVTGLSWECPECGFDNEKTDGYVDDWNDLFGICDKCEHHYEFPDIEPDDDYEPYEY